MSEKSETFENKVLGTFHKDTRLIQLQTKARNKGLRGDEVFEFIHLDRFELTTEIKSLKKELEAERKVVDVIGGEGYWSRKMEVKTYTKLLDEHTDMCRQRIKERGEG